MKKTFLILALLLFITPTCFSQETEQIEKHLINLTEEWSIYDYLNNQNQILDFVNYDLISLNEFDSLYNERFNRVFENENIYTLLDAEEGKFNKYLISKVMKSDSDFLQLILATSKFDSEGKMKYGTEFLSIFERSMELNIQLLNKHNVEPNSQMIQGYFHMINGSLTTITDEFEYFEQDAICSIFPKLIEFWNLAKPFMDAEKTAQIQSRLTQIPNHEYDCISNYRK